MHETLNEPKETRGIREIWPVSRYLTQTYSLTSDNQPTVSTQVAGAAYSFVTAAANGAGPGDYNFVHTPAF